MKGVFQVSYVVPFAVLGIPVVLYDPIQCVLFVL